MSINRTFFGHTAFHKILICLIYSALLLSLFLPFMEVYSREKINKSSELYYDGYVSILKGYECFIFWCINCSVTFLIHLKTFANTSKQNKYNTIVSTILYPLGLFMMFYTSGMSGNPFHDKNLIGFNLCIISTFTLIISSYFVVFNKKIQKRTDLE